jgi:hypothetical protein
MANNKLQLENHCVLQLLIKHKKFITPEFIKSFIDNFESEDIRRTNTRLKTMIEILKNFNLELVKDHGILVKKILNFVHQKPKHLNLKNILVDDEKIEDGIKSELSVLCVLSKKDVINFALAEKAVRPYLTDFFAKKHDPSYAQAMTDLEQLLQTKCLDRYVLNAARKTQNNVADSALPNDLKCVIDESLFEELRLILNLDAVIEQSESSDIGHTIDIILMNTSLYLQILNVMIRFASLNDEKFKKCILTKKVQYYLQELEVKRIHVQLTHEIYSSFVFFSFFSPN